MNLNFNSTPALHVRYYWDSRTEFWTANVDEVPEIVTQGPTLAKTYERVREALSLVREDAQTVSLKNETVWDDVREVLELPSDLRGLIKRETDLRLEQCEIEHKLRATTLEGVRQLVGAHSRPYRYVGQVLGITFQRVEQICNQLGIVRADAAASDRLQRS